MKDRTFAWVVFGGLALGLACAPAYALSKWEQHSQREGCKQLVTVKHPDAKGKAFVEEVKKCRANPDTYN